LTARTAGRLLGTIRNDPQRDLEALVHS